MKRKTGLFMITTACCLLGVPVSAGSLSSVTGPAQIFPMNDGSGKYMLKSDGFYCLREDGTLCTEQEVHSFDHFDADGTVFHGFYYHDADGLFCAGPSRYTVLDNQKVVIQNILETEDGSEIEIVEEMLFSGVFRVNNLGLLTAAPQVCYLEEMKLGDAVYNGFYFFNENGRLVRDKEIHYLNMTCNGRSFDGYYYFGGDNGALMQESCVTPEGFEVDESGRLCSLDTLTMDDLSESLTELLEQYDGTWSVYLKDLQSDLSLRIEDKQKESASLIKVFVMAYTYENMENVRRHQADQMGKNAEDPAVQKRIDDLLWSMITISDNESFNELVRLQSNTYDFKDGCKIINAYLKRNGFRYSKVQHTLQPSGTADDGIGGRNLTAASDCGKLLEQIYRGECVSREASLKMMNMLLNQKVDYKIPAGVPDDVICANKTGENDFNQHDVAVVYGENTDYVLCIMVEDYKDEGNTFNQMRQVSGMVYMYLNQMAMVRTEEMQE